MAFTDSADDPATGDVAGGDPQGDAGAPGSPAPEAAGQPPGPPQGGGPVLAALARRNQQPNVSAPGQGDFAKGLMMLKSAVDMLQAALPSLPAGSQQHKDAIKALGGLSKHLPQGAPAAGVQQTQLGDMLRNTVRNALMQRIMASQQGGGGAGGGPPGGGQQAPPPSTPMPGA